MTHHSKFHAQKNLVNLCWEPITSLQLSLKKVHWFDGLIAAPGWDKENVRKIVQKKIIIFSAFSKKVQYILISPVHRVHLHIVHHCPKSGKKLSVRSYQGSKKVQLYFYSDRDPPVTFHVLTCEFSECNWALRNATIFTDFREGKSVNN